MRYDSISGCIDKKLLRQHCETTCYTKNGPRIEIRAQTCWVPFGSLIFWIAKKRQQKPNAWSQVIFNQKYGERHLGIKINRYNYSLCNLLVFILCILLSNKIFPIFLRRGDGCKVDSSVINEARDWSKNLQVSLQWQASKPAIWLATETKRPTKELLATVITNQDHNNHQTELVSSF